jgi:hypothetical protein
MRQLPRRETAAAAIGKYHRISPFRHLVIDLMHFSTKVPSATVERRMPLASLCEARRLCTPAPTWSGIFAKAYARVAAHIPQLRTSYVEFPWPRFYEHSTSIATINVDRQLPNERIVLYAHVPNPQDLSLSEIDAIIRFHQDAPLKNISSYRHAARLSQVPWPFRRGLYWAGLNVFGSVRCANFGTFGISTVGCQGAGILHLLPIVTSSLHYGMLDSTGGLEMRLSFDHRVLDGATAAQALSEMEGTLLGEVTDECVRLARQSSVPMKAIVTTDSPPGGHPDQGSGIREANGAGSTPVHPVLS